MSIQCMHKLLIHSDKKHTHKCKIPGKQNHFLRKKTRFKKKRLNEPITVTTN